jgi:hypothetical protein
MFLIAIEFRNLLSKTLVPLSGLAGFFFCLQSGYPATPRSAQEPLSAGFRYMYNLDFPAAHKIFETWQHAHPEDPMGAASNAAAYLFNEFERLHILDLDLFTDKTLEQRRDQPAADPKIKVAFDVELSKADEIAEKVLAQSRDDRDALFARVLTDGLRGTYAGLIENKKNDALDFLKSSRSLAEKLIGIDPTYYDAYLAVGIENYLLGLRSAPTRLFLRLSGAQTSKQKGIVNLTITAEKGRYLAPYARLLLVIAALRDGDRPTAKKLLIDLARQFPQNGLYQLELGRL